MNKKILVSVAVLCTGLSACGGDKSNEQMAMAKSTFINNCIKQESSTRSVEQATSYCDCSADAIFSNKDISNETKILMPTMNDKGSKLYEQKDATKVKGSLMSCYTAKFYKK